jgi:outer membrane protein OmpA-like peptidoglycan-associated protein/tetratricopeptide (TPR) repeat protein
MKRSLLLLFCFFTFLKVAAQSSGNRKANAIFEKAQVLLQDQSYDLAVVKLKEAVKADPTFQNAYFQLAEVQRRLKEFKEAKDYYDIAIALPGKLEARVYYGLAESQLNTGDYAGALINYEQFLKEYTGKDPDFISLAKKCIKDCLFSIEAIKKPVAYQPVNLGEGINSKYREYFPAITADGKNIIFSRNLEGNEDFYISQKQGNIWGQAVPLSNKINTSKYNEGAQSISPDGMYLFFTGCNRPDGLGRCDIYVSRKKGKDWSEPFNLGAPVNSKFWDSQPAISPDGNVLYFVSNRPGGQGGYDIWKSELGQDGLWQNPVNLGPEINTPYDEHTPFIHPDGKTLYFSSNGWPGFGNKDIFYCRMDRQGKWGQPVNFGYPVNTYNEEMGLIVTTDGSEGLFSANISGGYGDMDIYRFKMPEVTKPQAITYVKGIVRDKETRQVMQSKILVTDLNTDKKQFNDFTSEDGDFLAIMPIGGSYALNVSSEGYLFYSENFELGADHKDQPFLIEVFLEKIKTGSNVTLKNIFFETNKYQLLPTSMGELGALIDLLTQNKEIVIEIQGHTDNVGDDKANEKLSLLRAKAVYDYLLEHKLPPDRLSFKGYGEAKPIADNQTEAGRKLNRRTSFMIIKI